MRVVLAGRLSQLQPGQTGMDSREREMVKWAGAGGHTIAVNPETGEPAITEDWRSGTTPLIKRPDLKPWVTKPEYLALYDALVTYESSRLSRGPKAMTNAIEAWAAEHGKQIVCIRENLLFPCEGIAGAMWDLAHRMNHQYWLDTSRMYLNMQKYLTENGYLTNRPMWGYEVIPSGDHKTLAPDPAIKPYIIAAIDHYMKDGWPLVRIAAWLTAERMLTPGDYSRRRADKPVKGAAWTPSTLSGIFRNPMLCGRQQNISRTATVLKVVPLIDHDAWQALQAKMDQKATRTGVLTDRPNGAKLTSILFCSFCHGPMYRITPKGYVYYRCYGTNAVRSKCGNMVPLADTDVAMDDAVMALADQPHRIPRKIKGSGHQEEIAGVKADMTEAVQAEDFGKLAELQRELARLRALPVEPDVITYMMDGRTVGEVYSALTDAQKRAWLLERGWRAYACKGEDGGILLTIDGGSLQGDTDALRAI